MAHLHARVHIKRIHVSDGTSVWLVNGERIRKELNENFVQSGHHARFAFIPDGEFWIDADTDFREHRFFIDRFFAERILLQSGISLEKAESIAGDLEQHERNESLSRELRAMKNHGISLIKKVHRTPFLPYHSDQLAVWTVDGKMVRDLLFLEYDMGGHDRVYPWIPDREIWIEDILPNREKRFILLHELHERYLMGKGKEYLRAHHGATIVEDRFRDYPETLEQRIREEYEKNLSQERI